MSVTICHASISENGNAGWDGKSKVGDQTGKEVCTRLWYDKSWDIVLRYKDTALAKKAAEIAKKLANSNLVGYDQSQRNTLYQALKKNNWNVDAYIKSGVKTETDCSAFMYAVWCCLIPSMRSDSNAPTTSTMRGTFSKYGFTVYKETKYTRSEQNLLTGDVLVKESTHTVMAITNGVNAGTKVNNESASKKKLYSGTFPSIPSKGYLGKGDKGTNVNQLQKFLNWYGKYGLSEDSSFGSTTESAVKKFQKAEGLTVDGQFGAKSLAKAKTIKR